MTVFRLYQQNRKKKIFLPNYQFLLGASDREESLGKDNTDRESFLLHLKQQDKAYPPKSVSLIISIFVYSDISHKVVGRPWASFTLIIKSPNVDPGYPQYTLFSGFIHCARYHPVGCGHTIGCSTPWNESSKPLNMYLPETNNPVLQSTKSTPIQWSFPFHFNYHHLGYVHISHDSYPDIVRGVIFLHSLSGINSGISLEFISAILISWYINICVTFDNQLFAECGYWNLVNFSKQIFFFQIYDTTINNVYLIWTNRVISSMTGKQNITLVHIIYKNSWVFKIVIIDTTQDFTRYFYISWHWHV